MASTMHAFHTCGHMPQTCGSPTTCTRTHTHLLINMCAINPISQVRVVRTLEKRGEGVTTEHIADMAHTANAQHNKHFSTLVLMSSFHDLTSALLPVHCSATSQSPITARHCTPAGLYYKEHKLKRNGTRTKATSQRWSIRWKWHTHLAVLAARLMCVALGSLCQRTQGGIAAGVVTLLGNAGHVTVM